MFKQFLKLFRGNEDLAAGVDHPHVETMIGESEKSYMEYLLLKVAPRVEERLKSEPGTDPILEVATSILLEMFPEHWEAPQGPLADRYTPRPLPPPPPAAPPAPVDEEEVCEVEEVQEEEAEDLEVEIEIEIIETTDVEEEEAEETPPAGFAAALDDTAEFEPPPVTRQPSGDSPWPMALQGDGILHGARILLAVLLDNERLPREEQLDVAEFLLAADLWIHLLAQHTEMGDRVQRLAKLVERKFGEGHFSQARLLLQVFPANAETRVNNDRQLFYEEMILRMGIRRRAPLVEEMIEEIREGLEGVSLKDDESLREGLRGISECAQAQMCLYIRDSADVERWHRIAAQASLPGAMPYVMGLIPPRRWREIWQEDRPVGELLREQFVKPMARDHVIDHLKTAYFVLRAVGDTGLEGYLDCFFDWSERVCGVNAVRALPEIYNRTLSPRELIDPVFLDIYQREYRSVIEGLLMEITDEVMEEACQAAVQRISAADLGGLAPGSFNLGGFILDCYLGIQYPTPEFGFRLHRLT